MISPRNPPEQFKSWNDFYDYIESQSLDTGRAVIIPETRYVDIDGNEKQRQFQVFNVEYSLNEIRRRALEELRQRQKTETFDETELRYLIHAMDQEYKLLGGVCNSSYPELTLRNKLIGLLYQVHEEQRREFRIRQNSPITGPLDELCN